MLCGWCTDCIRDHGSSNYVSFFTSSWLNTVTLLFFTDTTLVQEIKGFNLVEASWQPNETIVLKDALCASTVLLMV